MDGLVVLSLRPSVIAQHLTSHADVEPGTVMSGKVARVTEHGLVVTLTSNIKYAPLAQCALLPWALDY
jgi:ribosomal protein S1